MANEDHLEILRQGVKAWNIWRKGNPVIRSDLSGADLHGADLRNAYFSGADLRGANLREADLEEAGLSTADLRGADLSGANLREAKLRGANLSTADLRGANLSGANLSKANLREANLIRANLREADLSRTDLIGADLSGANLSGANLSEAEIANAVFRGAWLHGANMLSVAGGPKAHYLETTRLFPKQNKGESAPYRLMPSDDVKYFETCQRDFWDTYLDWEHLRTIGTFPLFGLSYAALLLIPVAFYLLSFYNQKIRTLREWANITTKQADNTMTQELAVFITQHIHPQPLPGQSFILLCSTILLGIAATIFLLCPSRVKQFTSDQWHDQLNRSLVHYFPLSWKYKSVRIICMICFIMGGIGVLYVMLTKIFNTAVFILENSTFPWYHV